MIKKTDLTPTSGMAAAPKLTSPQKTTLQALAEGPQYYEANYKPLEKLLSLGYAERKFKHSGMFGMSVYYVATPAGAERARELASKGAASQPQIS